MAALPETLTLAEATATLAGLGEALVEDGAQAELSIDASGLKSFDSSALAVLLECRRLALAGGKGFTVQGAPPQLAVLAGLYGVDELLGLVPPEDAPPVLAARAARAAGSVQATGVA